MEHTKNRIFSKYIHIKIRIQPTKKCDTKHSLTPHSCLKTKQEKHENSKIQNLSSIKLQICKKWTEIVT